MHTNTVRPHMVSAPARPSRSNLLCSSTSLAARDGDCVATSERDTGFSTTIGVEIEHLGLSLKESEKIAKPRGWHVVHDSSLSDDTPLWRRKYGKGNTSNEAISRVLPFAKRREAANVVRALKRAGARINTSCGTHVHVGAQDVDVHALLHLMHWWVANESAIYRMLGVCKNRENKFAKRLPPEIIEAVAKARPADTKAFREAYRAGVIAYIQRTSGTREIEEYTIYYAGRSWGINFAALEKYNTVEFRAFEATMSPERVTAYIELAHGAMKMAQSRSTFEQWDELMAGARPASSAADALAQLPLPAPALQHFLTMAEATEWAERQPVPSSLAGLAGEYLDIRDLHMRAAHRSAEACLTGARSLSLRGLVLQSLPPCLLGMKTLQRLDLRHNFFEDTKQVVPFLPGGLKSLDLRHNALPPSTLLPSVRAVDLSAQDMPNFMDTLGSSRASLPLIAGGRDRGAVNLFKAFTGHSDEASLSSNMPLEIYPYLEELRRVTMDVTHGGQLPDGIKHASGLQWIEVKGDLKAMPTWLGEFKDLRRLTLSDQYTQLACPDALFHLPNFWQVHARGKVLYQSKAQAKELDAGWQQNHFFVDLLYPSSADMPRLHTTRRTLRRMAEFFTPPSQAYRFPGKF